jgi:hypothetical protein
MSSQQLRRLEVARRTSFCSAFGCCSTKAFGGADPVDVGQRAAGIGREAEGQDRADIRLARIGNDAFLHHARRFQRDRGEESLLQLLVRRPVPGS